MALRDLVNVQISLMTSAVNSAGFGKPIFIGAHRWFTDRVRSYSSIAAVEDDIPIGSPEHKAMQSFFATAGTQEILVGRQEASTVISLPTVEEAETYTFTIGVTGGASAVISYTAAALDTAEEVVDAFILAINGSASVSAHVTPAKVGVAAAATLTLTPVTADSAYQLSTLTGVTTTYTAEETAAEVLSNIRDVDDSFYFVTAHDHSETFVLEMAAAVEAMEKIYFIGNQDVNALDALAEPAIDILGKLKESDYLRTAGIWHQDADEEFIELAYIGRFAKEQPGTYIWSAKQLAGVGASAHPTTGIKLNSTQRNNLDARNANFIVPVGGINVVRTGKVSGNEWIDVVRSRDLLEARLTEALQNKMINTGKIAFSDSGINSVRSVCESTFNRYVSTETRPNILQENNPFKFTFPVARLVSFADKSEGLLKATFVAYLAGAIRLTEISGTLTYEAQS